MKPNKETSREMIIKALEPFTISKPPFSVWTLTFGEHKSRSIGEGIEFKQFRPYEIGEDIANLDAEASLRTGVKLIRENITEEKVRHAVILDDSPSMNFHGIRETAFIAAGCYLLSAVKDRDPARVIRIGSAGGSIASPPVYSAENAIALILEYWDRPIFKKSQQNENKNELLTSAIDASRSFSFRNSRIALISDFAFKDAPVKYDSNLKKLTFGDKEAIQRAVSQILSYPQSSSLAFIGISPQWEKFKNLRGLFTIKDSEDGSSVNARFTKRRARDFIKNQYGREKAWQAAARSVNVPMLWLHAGCQVPYELRKASVS